MTEPLLLGPPLERGGERGVRLAKVFAVRPSKKAALFVREQSVFRGFGVPAARDEAVHRKMQGPSLDDLRRGEIPMDDGEPGGGKHRVGKEELC